MSSKNSAHVGPLHAGTALAATEPSHINTGTFADDAGSSPPPPPGGGNPLAFATAFATARVAMSPAHWTYAGGASYASSFSTWTSAMGPPRGARRRATESTTFSNHAPVSAIHRSSSVRIFRPGYAVWFMSQSGRPPNFHSAHTYGPILRFTNRPSSPASATNSSTRVRDASESSGWTWSGSSGSCTFQKT